MTTAYFDCFNGAGGDMIVASLIHAGADADRLREQLAALGLTGYSLSVDAVTRGGIAGTQFRVSLDEKAAQPHRHLSQIVEIIDGSAVTPPVKEKVARIFRRLAEAEAKVHGTTIEKVHFHEVGAVDAILDITGAVLALDLLGVEEVFCSPVPVGSGTVKCDHGIMPVPAPATAELLSGVPIAESSQTGELVTPTAASVLTTLASGFGPMPPMTIRSIGYGAGTREGDTRPNLLRVLIGDRTPVGGAERVAVLETNLDDTTGEVVGYCMERLLDAGALDVYAVPIQMKKSRPGLVLTVLCDKGRIGEMERIIFTETPTLGIRRREVERTTMTRRVETVETPFGPIRVKSGEYAGVVTVGPEYEDCRAAAVGHDVPLCRVIEAARKAWADRASG